jgi:hypothetical protein
MQQQDLPYFKSSRELLHHQKEGTRKRHYTQIELCELSLHDVSTEEKNYQSASGNEDIQQRQNIHP